MEDPAVSEAGLGYEKDVLPGEYEPLEYIGLQGPRFRSGVSLWNAIHGKPFEKSSDYISLLLYKLAF
jgi:hypothetical protein